MNPITAQTFLDTYLDKYIGNDSDELVLVMHIPKYEKKIKSKYTARDSKIGLLKFHHYVTCCL